MTLLTPVGSNDAGGWSGQAVLDHTSSPSPDRSNAIEAGWIVDQ